MVVLGDEDKKSNNHGSFETNKKQKGISDYLFISLVWLYSDCIFIGFE